MTLSSRERTLAMAVGAIVFVLLNLLLLTAFARRSVALRAQLAESHEEWSGMQQLLGEQGLWSAREAALTGKQPAMANDNAAGVELLDKVHALAKAHQVTVENEVFNGVQKAQWYQSVPVSLDTHSSWPDLISFLYALQKPDQFIVCEDANIQVDPGDQTKMVCHFKIARWYAP